MRARVVVVPLLAAGVCSVAAAQDGLRTLYLDECAQFGADFRTHESGNGLGTVWNDGQSRLVFVRPDGVTVAPLPSDIPGLTITDQAAGIRIGGVNADGSASVQLRFASSSNVRWAYAILSESGVRVDIAEAGIASAGVPLSLDVPLGLLTPSPRSMNHAGNSIARPGITSNPLLVAFGPGIEPRAFRGLGEPTPGINAAFLGERMDFPSPPDYRLGWPQAGVQYDINASGRAVYHAIFEFDGTSQTASAIFSDDPEFAAPLLRSDQPNAHGYRLIQYARTIRINSAGQVAMVGSLNDGQSSEFGVWSVTPDGDATLRVRDGDVFPGPGGVGEFQAKLSYAPSGQGGFGTYPNLFGNIFVQNDRGDVAFESLRLDNNRRVILYSGADGERATIFDTTAFLPGFVSWGQLGPPILSPDARSLAVELTGGPSVGFHTAIYVSGLDYGLREIIRIGQTLEVAPGDFREASFMRLLDYNGVTTTFQASFADGSCGVFTYTVPDCPADLNNDGMVDADDFFLFLQFFAAADPRADFNNDGVIDADDFFEYLNLFAQGC